MTILLCILYTPARVNKISTVHFKGGFCWMTMYMKIIFIESTHEFIIASWKVYVIILWKLMVSSVKVYNSCSHKINLQSLHIKLSIHVDYY